MSRIWVIAVALTSGSAWCEKPTLPSFDDHRVSGEYKGPVSPPHVGKSEQYSGTDVRCFADPAQWSAMRPNFAGHFVLAACSCGSGCHSLFIWDARNGKVYRNFPFGAVDVGPYRSAGGGQQVEYDGEQYRIDSNLLILDGCAEDTCDCAKRFYVWNGRRFRLILRKQERLPPKCLHTTAKERRRSGFCGARLQRTAVGLSPRSTEAG